MLIGALANVGLFPFAGFWAKDEILGGDFSAHYYLVWAIGIITAFMTAVFMFRLMFLTFWGENRAAPDVQLHIHESPRVMTLPLVILAVPAAVLGLVVGLPPDGGWLHTFLQPVFFNVETEHFAWAGTGGGLMLLSLAVVLAGIYTAYVAYLRRPGLPARVVALVPWAYQASYHKFYMDEFYDGAVIRPVMSFATWLWTFVDVKVIDGAVNGLAWAWGALGRALRPLQTGRAQSYALGVFGGLFVLVILIRYFWGA
jgi:NADH-quinone oxidoreductase subunit L